MDEKTRFILCIVVVVIVAFYAGGMFGFFPFLVGDITFRAVGFGTLIICTVIAVCTSVIVDAIKGKNAKEDPDKKENDDPDTDQEKDQNKDDK